MNKIVLIVVSLISVNILFGSDTKDESFIRTIPILEVNGDAMPGWEKQIIELYGDEEGNAMPVIFRGGAKNWKAAAWTPEYFAERFGDEAIVVVAAKLLDEEMSPTYTTFRDHIEDITRNPENAWYFFGELSYNSTKEALKEDAEDELVQNAIFMHTYLDLESQTRFPQSIDKSEIGEKRYYDVFIGAGNTVTNLHSHGSTFLAQIYGTKLATLVAPRYIKKCSCRMKDSKFVSCCDIDILKPDFEKYPELRDVEVHQKILEAGDVLYIPEGWPHDIRGLSTSINIAGGF